MRWRAIKSFTWATSTARKKLPGRGMCQRCRRVDMVKNASRSEVVFQPVTAFVGCKEEAAAALRRCNALPSSARLTLLKQCERAVWHRSTDTHKPTNFERFQTRSTWAPRLWSPTSPPATTSPRRSWRRCRRRQIKRRPAWRVRRGSAYAMRHATALMLPRGAAKPTALACTAGCAACMNCRLCCWHAYDAPPCCRLSSL